MRALAVLLCALPLPMAATPSPYGNNKARVLKALSADDIAVSRAGRGMGLSKPAELNRGYGAHDTALADAAHTGAHAH